MKDKNPWGKLSKANKSKVNKIAKTGLMGGKTVKLKKY